MSTTINKDQHKFQNEDQHILNKYQQMSTPIKQTTHINNDQQLSTNINKYQ